jgi:HEAT repeat protein
MTADGASSPKAEVASNTSASAKRLQIVRLLVALVICGGLVAWAGRVVWETRNPAVAAARNLRSRDQAQRLEAVEEVSVQGLTNPKDGIPALIGALADRDEQVRVAAAKSLGFVSSYSIRSGANADVVKDAAVALRASMKDPAPTVRIESARSLCILGGIGFAIPRRGAGEGRGRAGPAPSSPVDAKVLTEVLTELAGGSDLEGRLLVWQALGAVGSRLGMELPPKLLAGLASEPPENREIAIRALTAYGPAAATTVPVLTNFLKEAASTKARGKEAEGIARALGRIAPGTAMTGEAVTGLTEALRSESPLARVAAVQALERLGPQNAAAAVPRIKALENDPDTKVRDAAKSAIKALGVPAVSTKSENTKSESGASGRGAHGSL